MLSKICRSNLSSGGSAAPKLTPQASTSSRAADAKMFIRPGKFCRLSGDPLETTEALACSRVPAKVMVEVALDLALCNVIRANPFRVVALSKRGSECRKFTQNGGSIVVLQIALILKGAELLLINGGADMGDELLINGAFIGADPGDKLFKGADCGAKLFKDDDSGGLASCACNTSKLLFKRMAPRKSTTKNCDFIVLTTFVSFYVFGFSL
ncbi:OLC1v1012533C1 [Oldenlandia corymbosa var. corymbosa]|uniref:OLC1v1012533C1 n=1 Tax=Oldenlandia corymbosa var. corymbosa TaxID=529605 RepID=A0AAV1DZI9_OLDCO|nr:OLC1v1012533C1 [Oldenlandia corymbosa var. corymbosa]